MRRLSVFIALIVIFGLSGLFIAKEFGSKAANYGPISAESTMGAVVDSSGKRITDYQTSDTLVDGQSVRVRVEVTINQSSSVTFYSNYGKDGAFGWAQINGFDRRGGDNIIFSLPSGKSLQYVQGSTQYTECNTATNTCDPAQKIADDSFGETPLFQMITRNLTFQDNRRYAFYYDLKVVNEPTPVFNGRSDDAPTLQVRDVTQNGSFGASVSNVNPGDTLEFYFYVHNNPRGSVATGTTIGIQNWSTGSANSFNFTGFIEGSNFPTVTSIVNINLNQSSTLSLISGSANWTGFPTVLGQKFTNSSLSDSIITPSGVQIGDTGVQEGCWDFLSKAFFRATVMNMNTPTPTPTATPTMTPTPTPSPTPTAGPTSSCQTLSETVSSGTAPLTINFTGSGTDSTGSIQQYQFNFGDSSNGQNQIVTTDSSEASHIYYNQGNFTANLLVKDSRGNWVGGGDCQRNITVNSQPTVLGATAPPVLPKTGNDDGVIVAMSSIPTIILGIYLYKRFKLL